MSVNSDRIKICSGKQSYRRHFYQKTKKYLIFFKMVVSYLQSSVNLRNKNRRIWQQKYNWIKIGKLIVNVHSWITTSQIDDCKKLLLSVCPCVFARHISICVFCSVVVNAGMGTSSECASFFCVSIVWKHDKGGSIIKKFIMKVNDKTKSQIQQTQNGKEQKNEWIRRFFKLEGRTNT